MPKIKKEAIAEIINLFIHDLEKLGGPTHQQVLEASYIYNTMIQRADNLDDSEAIRLARAIAILSFRPAGIVFQNKLYIRT